MNVHALDPGRAVAEPVRANPLVYAARTCLGLGCVTELGRTYKLYVILSDIHAIEDCPDRATVQRLILAAFTGWDAPEDHPLGFGILHLARDGTYVLASRWSNANNLRHRVFGVDLSCPDPVPQPLADAHVVACVWELNLIKHEVDAWISAVLQHGAPAVSAEMIGDYAARQFTGAL